VVVAVGAPVPKTGAAVLTVVAGLAEPGQDGPPGQTINVVATGTTVEVKDPIGQLTPATQELTVYELVA
jgi:hypothetical protein